MTGWKLAWSRASYYIERSSSSSNGDGEKLATSDLANSSRRRRRTAETPRPPQTHGFSGPARHKLSDPAGSPLPTPSAAAVKPGQQHGGRPTGFPTCRANALFHCIELHPCIYKIDLLYSTLEVCAQWEQNQGKSRRSYT
jgi:hypothetical protein